jgi:putative Mn2+ efflux pump MntP
MSLHLFSLALMAISANVDSLAVAIACRIKKIKITIGANLTIAIVSSLGTFLSMSIGQMISGYLHRSTANILGSGVPISIGIGSIDLMMTFLMVTTSERLTP